MMSCLHTEEYKVSVDVISVDFWNTMFSSHHVPERQKKERWEYKYSIYNNLAKKYNQPNYSQEQIEKAIKKEHKVAFDVWKNEQRTMNLSDRIRITLDELDLDVSEDDINKLVTTYNNFIFYRPPVQAKNLNDTLERILDRGIKLAVISDTGYILGSNIKKFLESRDLLKYFSAFSFSDETGSAKPNRKAFTKIMDDFNIDDPSSLLHVGDMEEIDVFGANNAGFKSCIYTGLYTTLRHDPFETNANIHIDNWENLIDYLI